MKFDTIIIGGGLTGLTCAIALQRKGQRCAVISAGQSALHFSSGSFDLLNTLPDGTEVDHPEASVALLPESHPYRKIGDKFPAYAEEARRSLIENGIGVHGSASANHFRYTPMGTLKRTWLTLSEFGTVETADSIPEGRVLVANFAGFLDFNTSFIVHALRERGADCEVAILNVAGIDRLRESPTEMRASNIARALENEDTWKEMLETLAARTKGFDHVILPAVFGLKNDEFCKKISAALECKTLFLPTMPPSVPGIRTQMTLRRTFEQLGGVYTLGDTVQAAVIEGDRVKSIYTANHVDVALQADNFVLASGHFFSGGLVADMDSVREPVFGCDVDYDQDRSHWYESSVFGAHGYFRFGVAYGEDFRLRKNGRPYSNLYGAGSVLSGADSRSEGSGAGVSLLTALRVADLIMEGR